MAERRYGGLTLDELERFMQRDIAICDQQIRALIARAREADGKEEGGVLWEPVSYGINEPFAPTIDKTYQRDGSALWKVRRGGACLNKLGEWEWEPQPSSRDDEFLDRCRYRSLEEAISAAMAKAHEAADDGSGPRAKQEDRG